MVTREQKDALLAHYEDEWYVSRREPGTTVADESKGATL
jgi:hypothetical protein